MTTALTPTHLTIPAHLSDEDARLYVDLYCERNRVPRSELHLVRDNIAAAQERERIARVRQALGIPA